jgi:hypothetical protein
METVYKVRAAPATPSSAHCPPVQSLTAPPWLPRRLQTFMRRNSVYIGFILVGAFAGDKVRRRSGLRRTRALPAATAAQPSPRRSSSCLPAAGQRRGGLDVGVQQQGGELARRLA